MKKNNNINIGSAIRTGRRKKKWKQKDLAKILDISPSLVSSWEANIRIPAGDDLIEIANLLDIVDLLFPHYEVILKNSDEKAIFMNNFLLKEESLEYKVAGIAESLQKLQNRIEKLESQESSNDSK